MKTLGSRVRYVFANSHVVRWIVALTLLAISGSPVQAVVPSGNNVPVIGAAGNFSSAVQIFNNQGAAGTATLFMEKPDPFNANYLDMCFVTADHVMRNVVVGPSPENDTLPYDSNDNYGGTPSNVQPAPNAYLQAITVGSVGDPSGFTLSAANGSIVASQVKLGNSIDMTAGLPPDMAFVGITVDLTKLPNQNNGAIAADTVQNILMNMPQIPLAVAPQDPNAAGGAKFDFSMKGGYGVTGSFDPANAAYAYVYHPLNPLEQYGNERTFDNTVQLYKTVNNAVYAYPAMQWNLGQESNAIQLAGTGGMGMPGDSGSAIIVGNKITGILTAGRMDNLGAGQLGLKNGFYEYAAQMTPNSVAALNVLCANYNVLTAPEPSSFVLAGIGVIALVAFRRRR